MPSKMRKDIYIFVKDKTFIRSASFPRVMTHFYFSPAQEINFHDIILFIFLYQFSL